MITWLLFKAPIIPDIVNYFYTTFYKKYKGNSVLPMNFQMAKGMLKSRVLTEIWLQYSECLVPGTYIPHWCVSEKKKIIMEGACLPQPKSGTNGTVMWTQYERSIRRNKAYDISKSYPVCMYMRLNI